MTSKGDDGAVVPIPTLLVEASVANKPTVPVPSTLKSASKPPSFITTFQPPSIFILSVSSVPRIKLLDEEL